MEFRAEPKTFDCRVMHCNAAMNGYEVSGTNI